MAICAVRFCRTEGALLYHGNEVCQKHWLRDCDDDDPFSLKDEFPDKSHGTGLTLVQAKVFLDNGDDVLLIIDSDQCVLFKAEEYDEDLTGNKFARLIYDREWELKVSRSD